MLYEKKKFFRFVDVKKASNTFQGSKGYHTQELLLIILALGCLRIT